MTDRHYTADELRTSKAEAFLAAYSGHSVIITNVRFPGGHFELRFVKPEPIEKAALTDEQKTALIKEMTRGPNSHLNFHFPDDLPGYAIIWQKDPHPVTGLTQFRWTNYAMRNGLADTFEECLQSARDYAAKHEVAK